MNTKQQKITREGWESGESVICRPIGASVVSVRSVVVAVVSGVDLVDSELICGLISTASQRRNMFFVVLRRYLP